MSDYYAQAVSREDLRQLAYVIRKEFGYLDVWRIPVERLLDQMCEAFDDFSYEIIPDEEWEDKSTHADTDILGGTIRIRESIYNRACDGQGRDRMTIAHEMAHYILSCVIGVKLYSRRGKHVECYNDPEWQAKCLAGELLIPYYKLKSCSKIPSPLRIELLCGVSSDAAEYQLKYLAGGDVS
ncbi:MAG: ImmA/IrrE family metallo-endopeptidase [Clostridiales bacterium]|nr:ImmA/IrrE family metallo-endopeptidase [Clostridiales bacterium]